MSDRQEYASISVDEGRLDAMLQAEQSHWYAGHQECRRLHDRAKKTQLHGTPTYRVNHFPSAVPIFITEANGARLTDVDGHSYADFSLSGSAALFGHRHPKAVAAMREQLDRALMSDWPTEDHVQVTELMQQKFGLPIWQFSLSAADANRFALRFARIATGRQKILVFNNTYHGSLDETHAVLDGGQVVAPDGVSRNGFDVSSTTVVAEFNDIEATERLLRSREVAAVIVEPAITTRRSIVMPSPDFHRRLREITRATNTLLIVDETQTIVAGPGGFTQEFGLEPDILTMGKWAAGGLPIGMYGMTDAVAQAVAGYDGRVMGSTLAGGALSTHVMKTALSEIITEDSYALMTSAASRYADGVQAVISRLDLPWHVARLGARVAFWFDPAPPASGTISVSDAQAEARAKVHEAFWFFLANRGVLMSGWDCTSLFCPLLEEADVTAHLTLVEQAIEAVVAQ
ncbi:transaminase [Devosia sp. 2618]|uniref:transaminase n=1 Tax=Devosia sp. 2618 TaxID=3156454 RepID=UPI00339922B8